MSRALQKNNWHIPCETPAWIHTLQKILNLNNKLNSNVTKFSTFSSNYSTWFKKRLMIPRKISIFSIISHIVSQLYIQSNQQKTLHIKISWHFPFNQGQVKWKVSFRCIFHSVETHVYCTIVYIFVADSHFPNWWPWQSSDWPISHKCS